ncbi:TonB-dependent receptor [Acidipila sp. EB88]|uniref:TonB-dependent receptor n=1 Tax=Acidipila sp. EB88 TaxID=2305226 RepID=UPI000F5FBCCD|nr:TonB-dependent receptor [Acidipila sp. EB88]RRA48714.1 hypothetical protein D1Y84_10890 [Acidipila sp. EB88]
MDASNSGTLNTADAQISAALTPQAVLDLPANYRGAGSTSPLNVIQTLPGVQPDSGAYPPSPSASPAPGIKFSLQGGLPSQSETTIDGISAQNQTTNNILGDAFPSAESIAEIRVDGVNNNAEYAQPGEITTVTKAGTDALHGSAFWYFQNSAFDAIPFGTDRANKPKKVANDFGGFVGGPVLLPHLYNGRDRTFFFATYEGLRFPQSTVLQALVPTVLMKQGNFSQETAALVNPFTGGLYANQVLPSINKSSSAFLQFYPDPNVGSGGSLQNAIATTGYNYLSTRRRDIDSNQYDLRLDQAIGSKGSVFARFTSKNIAQVQPVDLTLPNSSAIGQYRIFAAVANYAFSPRLANEFRFGFTLEQDGSTSPYNGAAVVNAAALSGVGPNFPFNGISHIGFDSQLASIGERLDSTEQSRIFQYVDNVTMVRAAHTVRLGVDVRHLAAITPLDFSSSDNYGNFYFTQASSFTGQEFADFLLGAPYQTQIDNVTANNNGNSDAYAVYAQDNWKATPRLNITFGLRYELHPAFSDKGGNIGNFEPSAAKSGTLLYPAGFAGNLAPAELANLNACATAGVTNPYATNGVENGAPCTPVLSNKQAGLPQGLRTYPKLRFEPRFGFAYRPFGNDRTAIRGGAGYYNITTSGALFYALTGTLQANVQTFNNVETATGPAFSFPAISTAGTNSFAGGNFAPAYGSVSFNSAVDIHWHDPYSLQTNLSVDHDFGHGFGLRVSYVGLHTWHLVWQPELNMLPLSTSTPAQNQPRTAFAYPNFYSIAERSTAAQADYHSGQVELSHRFSKGMSLDSAYTLAKNLSDNQGTAGAFAQPGSFVDEQGGYYATYTGDRHLDYGNVTGTRRNRWLTTSVYELPFGRGKHFLGASGHTMDLLVGGWQVSNIFVWQSGPFLTAYLPAGGADPSGTGAGSLFGRNQRPDRIAKGNLPRGVRTRNQWFNAAAFTCPGGTGLGGTTGAASLQNGNCVVGSVVKNAQGSVVAQVAPIGRFGTEGVGDLTGPGTITLSSGASKSFRLTEALRLRAEGTFTNILNHTNLADPQLDVTQANFGQITQARGSDFGGNRTGQVTMRLEF